MEIPTNPDVLRFAYYLLASLTALMASIISFLIIDKYKLTKKALTEREQEQRLYMDKIEGMLDRIKETVSNLSIIVEVIKTQQEERDPRMDMRLQNHSNKIKELDIRISKTEEHCRLKNKLN